MVVVVAEVDVDVDINIMMITMTIFFYHNGLKTRWPFNITFQKTGWNNGNNPFLGSDN